MPTGSRGQGGGGNWTWWLGTEGGAVGGNGDVESLCAVTPATPDEESHNGFLDSAASSFYDSTDGAMTYPAPQPLPLSADDDGANPKEDKDSVGGGEEGQEGEDDDEVAMFNCGLTRHCSPMWPPIVWAPSPR
ncbi:hypothetical protein GUJ93_ZPchr0013g33903 [Zizania palustris]|uniref:Uncharacterized protein n=1 Tax=Zizania palustris TaxID=103762 RepID=A0A8J6BZV3_ZIZPA|nr:hypothetical protein GUJ93_ZPchr0013g33903 [Zizania palustris]